MVSQEALVNELRSRLDSIIDRKHGHVFAVINFMNLFIRGDFEGLYKTFTDIEVNKEEYIGLVKKLFGIYQNLSPEGKQILEVVTVFHDMGAIKQERDWTHNQRSADMAREVLTRLGAKPDFIERVSKIIFFHGGFANLGVDLLPRDFQDFSDEDKDILLLFNIFDGSGRAEGNRATPNKIKDFIAVRENDGSVFTEENFYEYRMGMSLTPLILTTQDQRGRNQKGVFNILVKKGVINENFINNWNNLIRIYVFGLFQAAGNESYELLARLIIDINNVIEENKAKYLINDVIVDTDIDFMGLFPHENKKPYVGNFLSMLRSDAPIPMEVSYNDGTLQINIKFSEKPGDKALVSNPGGIDFNAKDMNLKEQGSLINFSFRNLQNIQPNKVNGILPVIINIRPMTDLRLFLGLAGSSHNVPASS